VAAAIRERLLPVADVIAPNRFELAWLTGLEIRDAASAAAAARRLEPPLTLATSIPAGEGRLLTMAVSADATDVIGTERRPFVPHGTGDLLSGLFLGHLVRGEPAAAALARAMAALERVLEESAGTPRLDLTALDAVSELHPCP
jgi:pyridoxine kinase